MSFWKRIFGSDSEQIGRKKTALNIEGDGPMRLITNDSGTIHGIWVKEIEDAELESDFRSKLRTFFAMKAATGFDIPAEVYAAVARGLFRVEKNRSSSGGGYMLMFD